MRVDLGLEAQRRVDRRREARIIELDRERLAAIAAALGPGGAELDGAGEDPEVGRFAVVLLLARKVALTLQTSVLIEPVKPSPFFLKVPMVAM